MRVLIVGGGGREHALGWRLGRDHAVNALYFLPGNGGTRRIGTNLPGPLSYPRLRAAVNEHGIGMVVFGPEAPLVEGMADRLRADYGDRLAVVGPGAEGAQLEGSKAFAKAFMQRHGIPTAEARTFHRSEHADLLRYLQEAPYPLVIKASGLAAGKGVIICTHPDEARAAAEAFFVHDRFGKAGHQLVVEENLEGRECSVFILTDGRTYRHLPAARDYKRAYDGDRGPNTGGMGTFTPVPDLTPALETTIRRQIIEPTLAGLRTEGISFRGFLFFGLMLTERGPYVLEYNVRLGDPETQVILPMTEGAFAAALEAAARGRLEEASPLDVREGAQLAVIAASEGYPGAYAKGHAITGIEAAEADPDVIVFHAGTQWDGTTLRTSGGRVLAVSAHGSDLAHARASAYRAIQKIHFEGMFYRKDI